MIYMKVQQQFTAPTPTLAPVGGNSVAVTWHAGELRDWAGAACLVHGVVTSLETAMEKLSAAFKQ